MSWGQKTQHHQPGKEVLGQMWVYLKPCVQFWATIEKWCKAVSNHPKKGIQNDGKPQGQGLQGASDIICFIQLGKEAEGYLHLSQ